MGAVRRSWWALYALGAALAVAALSWISVLVCNLEDAERLAREDNAFQESVRLALWRMDSWFAPQLAIEVARLPREYRAYSPQDDAYTRGYSKLEPGEVLVPSPLLSFQSNVIQLHFQVNSKGQWSSPQLPTSNRLDLAEAAGLVTQEQLTARREVLADLQGYVSYKVLNGGLCGITAQANGVPTPDADGQTAEPQQGAWQSVPNFKNVQERQLRQQTANIESSPDNDQLYGFNGWIQPPGDGPGASASSPLVPMWIEAGDELQLCFVRRIRTSEGDLFQGFLADWRELERELLSLVGDLLPEAQLDPQPDVRPELDEQGRLLATVPATLAPGGVAATQATGWSPAMTTLAVSWLATLIALGAVGLGLRSSITYGEKRSRFASTVTHELRTPLTTFRMYSEMLANDMVPAERRKEYLQTLERESDRLGTLVDNVLAYSRLEDGRGGLRREPTTTGELFAHVEPELRRRAAEAGMQLELSFDPVVDLVVSTDAEAVEQILFNLVDNACKYGRVEGGGEIRIEAEERSGSLCLRVSDAGPGVTPAAERAIFQAFDRGDLDVADPNPGVGLGLALSRGLARDLGGDLVLEQRGERAGASFRLSLPRAS